MWDSIQVVTTPLALIAFVVAVIAHVWRTRTAHRLESIRSAEPDDRSALVEITLREVPDLDLNTLSQRQRFELATRILDDRKDRFRTFARVATLALILLATLLVLSFLLSSSSIEEPTGPAIEETSATSDSSAEHISVEYARLFGAYQVPWLLAMSRNADEWGMHRASTGDEDSALREWWERRWPYKDALVESGSVWRDEGCSGDEQIWGVGRSNPLLFLSAAASEDREATALVRAGLFYQNGGEEFADEVPDHLEGAYSTLTERPAEADHHIERVASRIGFLFLAVENDSGERLDDLAFQFRRFPYSQNSWSTVQDSVFNFDTVLPSLSGLPDPAVVRAHMQGAAEEGCRLGQLEPGQKVLWLLSVYVADERGMPSHFLSGVVEPARITYRMRGERSDTLVVRHPTGSQTFSRTELRLPAGDTLLWVGWHGQ